MKWFVGYLHDKSDSVKAGLPNHRITTMARKKSMGGYVRKRARVHTHIASYLGVCIRTLGVS